MKGDFSRDTFQPLRHFSRVLMQQGRLQLDADWNEQADILLYFLRTLARDLIGEHGGSDNGFHVDALVPAKRDFLIQRGRYYVDGILIENDEPALTYTGQHNFSSAAATLKTDGRYFVYLDVWERHITALDDEAIREVALGTVDTATRAQVVWQVRVTGQNLDGTPIVGPPAGGWPHWLAESGWPEQWRERWQPANRGLLKAKGKSDTSGNTNPCMLAPDARFRGLENQLYRIEVHTGGAAGVATFKWSRDNGSVVFTVTALADGRVKLASWGRGDRSDLNVGESVEIVDDDIVLSGLAGRLATVSIVDTDDMTVTLSTSKDVKLPEYAPKDFATKHVQLRRWDHKVRLPTPAGSATDGAVLIEESGDREDKWFTLEDGVQIQFVKPKAGAHTYQPGDYWLIPARTATGDVEWPGPLGNPEALRPRGVQHHFAPLAVVAVEQGDVEVLADLRRLIKPLAE